MDTPAMAAQAMAGPAGLKVHTQSTRFAVGAFRLDIGASNTVLPVTIKYQRGYSCIFVRTDKFTPRRDGALHVFIDT